MSATALPGEPPPFTSPVQAGLQITRRRPGRPTKPLCERASPYQKPIKKKLVVYGRKRRTEILVWLANHRIEEELTYDPYTENKPQKQNSYLGPGAVIDREEILGKVYRSRPPTFEEASAHFKVPVSTLSYWWKNRDPLLKIYRHASTGAWPALEEALFNLFCYQRSRLGIVTARWFKKTAERLWIELYPEQKNTFKFSIGWFSK